jgi:hypothetical protein
MGSSVCEHESAAASPLQREGLALTRGVITRIEESASGKRLVVACDSEKGTVVSRFSGPIVPASGVPESEIRYALMIAPDQWLLPSNDSRWINHSCDANAWVEAGTFNVITLRTLREGDEVTIDYATVAVAEFVQNPDDYVWNPSWSFDCLCGSALCRGRIDGYQLVGSIGEWNSRPGFEVAEYPGRGRGIRALRKFRKGECIERSHVIVIPREQWPSIEHTVFFDHTFYWGEDEEDAALALGFGSLFNHSYRPNAVYTRFFAEGQIHFFTLRDIEPGEEVTINYNGDPADDQPLWFTPLTI